MRVTLEGEGGGEPVHGGLVDQRDAIRYDAGPGELNDVVIRHGSSQMVIRDTAGVTAGTGCVQVSGEQARCKVMPRVRRRSGLIVAVLAYASDGADRLSFTGRPFPMQAPTPAADLVRLSGEAGDDTITGGTVLDGGDGDDVLISEGRGTAQLGGAGNDVMRGGSSNDSFVGGAGSDEIHGGGGATACVSPESPGHRCP